MNRVAKTFLQILTVLVIALAILVVSSWVLYPKDNDPAVGIADHEAHGVMGERADSLDVIFVGDSEFRCSISPMQIWNEEGFASYVCSTNAQTLPYTYTLLKRALKEQKPEVVVLNALTVAKPVGYGDAAVRTLKDIFPVFEYHFRWKHLTFDDFVSAPQATWSHNLKGFYIKRDVTPADTTSYMLPSDDVYELSPLNRYYLDKIVELIKESGAIPLIIASPSAKNWDMAKHNGMVAISEELGIDFIDLNLMNDQIGLDWNLDSHDGGDHLNTSGALKVSSALGKLLKEKYELPDRREDPEYANWHDTYQEYLEIMSE